LIGTDKEYILITQIFLLITGIWYSHRVIIIISFYNVYDARPMSTVLFLSFILYKIIRLICNRDPRIDTDYEKKFIKNDPWQYKIDGI